MMMLSRSTPPTITPLPPPRPGLATPARTAPSRSLPTPTPVILATKAKEREAERANYAFLDLETRMATRRPPPVLIISGDISGGSSMARATILKPPAYALTVQAPGGSAGGSPSARGYASGSGVSGRSPASVVAPVAAAGGPAVGTPIAAAAKTPVAGAKPASIHTSRKVVQFSPVVTTQPAPPHAADYYNAPLPPLPADAPMTPRRARGPRHTHSRSASPPDSAYPRTPTGSQCLLDSSSDWPRARRSRGRSQSSSPPTSYSTYTLTTTETGAMTPYLHHPPRPHAHSGFMDVLSVRACDGGHDLRPSGWDRAAAVGTAGISLLFRPKKCRRCGEDVGKNAERRRSLSPTSPAERFLVDT